jgi:DMSO/TMAO reductase YedYZ molybdopterin-dependent catalytic subunit
MTSTRTSDLARAFAGKSTALIPLGDGLNFSAPLDLVAGTVVPSELFFVRCNNPPAELTSEQWVLRVDGLVRHPITLGLNELRLLANRSQEVWLECAGNGRALFEPPTEGNQWGESAVSNAVFTGVALRDVLDAAGVEPSAIELVTTGADNGFQRGLPIEVALHPDVMLAWEMNGAPIPSVNGGPVRLLVPRWAGIASVKWPVRIELVDQPFRGYFNAERYIFVDRDGHTVRTVRELPVKSVFAWPADDATLELAPHTLFGFAWSGFGRIASVEVSTNGGQTWSPARLQRGAGDHAWTRWELDWAPPQAGSFELAVRATDDGGNTQPDMAQWNRFGYEMNAVATRSVVVTAT